jgi:hypothetical protein
MKSTKGISSPGRGIPGMMLLELNQDSDLGTWSVSVESPPCEPGRNPR